MLVLIIVSKWRAQNHLEGILHTLFLSIATAPDCRSYYSLIWQIMLTSSCPNFPSTHSVAVHTSNECGNEMVQVFAWNQQV